MAYTLIDRLKGLWPTYTEEDVDSIGRESVVVLTQTTGAALAEFPVWKAPCSCYIERVDWVAAAVFTANTTNYDTYAVLKRTTASSYTTTAAVAAADTSATSFVAHSPFELSTYGTAAARTLAVNDVLTFSIVDAGTTTEVGGQLVVTYRRVDSA